MSKIYVAGKNLDRARTVMDTLTKLGHTITFDWVADINNNTNIPEKAIQEREAVISADILVYLWEADQESARYEAGMAMGLRKQIIVSGFPEKQAWFTTLPEVVSVASDEDIYAALVKI